MEVDTYSHGRRDIGVRKIAAFVFLGCGLTFLPVAYAIEDDDQPHTDSISTDGDKLFAKREAPRIAFVVGAETYDDMPEAEGVISDASTMAQRLSEVGFIVSNVFTAPEDTSYRTLFKKLEELHDNVISAEPAVVLFYFAGHGFQVGEHNFIVPSDAMRGSLEQLLSSSIPLYDVAQKLRPPTAGFLIVIVDACRSVISLRDRGDQLPEVLALEGPRKQRTFYAYSAVGGKPAYSKSLYTATLAAHIAEKGIAMQQLFNDVREIVSGNSSQLPNEFTTLFNTFFFLAPSGLHDNQIEWLNTLHSSSEAEIGKSINRFLRHNPESFYGGAALQWLKEHHFHDPYDQ